MKIKLKKHLTKILFACIAVIIVSIYSCRKKSEVIEKNKTQTEIGESAIASWSNIPTYLIPSPVDSLDQFRRHALGFCNLLSNPAAMNNSDLISALNTLIIANNETPCRMATLHNHFNTNPTVYFGAPGDFYSGLSTAISLSVPPTPISVWDNSFYQQFGILVPPPTVETWHNTVTIPMRSYQIDNNHHINGIPLVVPDPDFFGYPARGYTYNTSTNSIDELLISDEDNFDDLMEDPLYFVVTVQCEVDPVDEFANTNNCEGSWQANDNHCDGDCGENETNSPADCGDHTKNKEVYLRKFRINKDVADRKNNNGSNEKKHWERWTAGQYDPIFSSWTIQTNGRFQGRILQDLIKVKHKDVRRERIKKSGRVKGHGSSNWIAGVDDNGQELVVAEFYNPTLSILYVTFSEHDHKTRITVPIFEPNNSTTPFDAVRYRGDRGNFIAGKWQSAAWPLGSGTNTTFYDAIFPDPNLWVDDVFDGEPVKVLRFATNADNRVDYELYYFRDKGRK